MEEVVLVCKNKWCKAHFRPIPDDIAEVDGKKVYPKFCNKCKCFENELSGGISWEDKKYEGDPWKGPHEIRYKVTKYK